MKTTIKIILCSALTSSASVIWQPAPNALASASWDSWSYAPPPGQTGSGSQGVAQETTGSLITTSEVEMEVMDSYDFPGGLGGNPDTYYFHTGGGRWTGSLQLSQQVSHVRISYSLLDFGGGSPEPYPLPPSIAGGTVIDEGSYPSDDGLILGTVFFKDFALSSPQDRIESSFGDVVFPGYPGSFRSLDGVRMEVFQAAPVPEPSAALLALIGAGLICSRRTWQSAREKGGR